MLKKNYPTDFRSNNFFENIVLNGKFKNRLDFNAFVFKVKIL